MDALSPAEQPHPRSRVRERGTHDSTLPAGGGPPLG